MITFTKQIKYKDDTKSNLTQIDTSKVPTRIPGKIIGVTIESIVKDYFESRPKETEYTISNEDGSTTIYTKT